MELEAYYRVHKTLLDTIQVSPVKSLPPYFLKIHLNIIFQRTSRLYKFP